MRIVSDAPYFATVTYASQSGPKLDAFQKSHANAVADASTAAFPETLMAATPVGRNADPVAPSGPSARLKSASAGAVGGGPSEAATTAVAADWMGPAVPAVLVAVTATRIVVPTSVAVRV